MLTKVLETEVATTKYGSIKFFERDMYISTSLRQYGEYCEGEPRLWAKLVGKGGTMIDVGANIGALTLAMYSIVGLKGTVIAFEPQQQNFDLLVHNTRNFANCHRVALSSASGTINVPDLTELGHENFGCIEVGKGSQSVECRTLDSYDFSKVDLIKIDVEGHEAEVIRGATETIKRCRPFIYAENDRPEKANELLQLIRSLDYRIYEHITPLFNPENWADDVNNVFGNVVSINILCVPNEKVSEFKDVLKDLKSVVPATPNVGKTGWAGIVRLGGIGDDLIAASVLRPLKKMGYKVEVLSQAPQCVVFENNPYVDKLAVKGADDLPQGGMLEWQKYFDKRGHEYDRFINLSHSCEGTLVPFPAMTAFWWPEKFRRKQFGKSYLETVHDIVDVPYDFGPLFFPTDEEKEDAIRLKTKAADGRPVIAWCLNGTRIDKVYPFAPMAVARLINDLKATVVILGAPAPAKDAQMAVTIQDHVTQQNGTKDHLFTNLGPSAGAQESWPIRRSLTFCGIADLVIGPDTGLMWGVAFEQVPKIMLHSHASMENITKHWLNTTSLHADAKRVPCWPCHRLHDEPETCVQNAEKNGAACISDISVETIVQTAAHLLKKG